MEIFQIAGLGIIASLVLLLLRKERPELAVGATLVAGLLLFFMVLPGIREAVSAFGGIAQESGLEPLYFGVILKVLAISYVADFAAAICRDAGEELMATRVEMAGKVLILVTSLPVVREVLDVIRALLA